MSEILLCLPVLFVNHSFREADSKFSLIKSTFLNVFGFCSFSLNNKVKIVFKEASDKQIARKDYRTFKIEMSI